jgi:hypothetical protein
MTNEQYKNVRSINLHVGRLSAIKYLRAVLGVSFETARVAVDDITTNKPWTKPQIKADLNWWEMAGQTAVAL